MTKSDTIRKRISVLKGAKFSTKEVSDATALPVGTVTLLLHDMAARGEVEVVGYLPGKGTPAIFIEAKLRPIRCEKSKSKSGILSKKAREVIERDRQNTLVSMPLDHALNWMTRNRLAAKSCCA